MLQARIEKDNRSSGGGVDATIYDLTPEADSSKKTKRPTKKEIEESTSVTLFEA